MHARNTPLDVKKMESSDKYIKVVVRDDEHFFKLPNLVDVCRIFSIIDSSSMAAFDTLIKGVSNPVLIINALKTAGPNLSVVVGAAIGICWEHPTLSLDTVIDNNELAEYGENVIRELDDADYELLHVLQIGGILVKHVFENSQNWKEAMQFGDFFTKAATKEG